MFRVEWNHGTVTWNTVVLPRERLSRDPAVGVAVGRRVVTCYAYIAVIVELDGTTIANVVIMNPVFRIGW